MESNLENASKKQTKSYLIITFCMTYLAWGFIILYTQINQVEFNKVPFLYFFYILGVIAPMISGIIVQEKDKRKKFIKSIYTPKLDIFTFLFILIIALLTRILPSMIENNNIFFSISIFTQIPLFILFGGLEEVGWRGVLQPNFDKYDHQIQTSVIVGIIWTIWHLPLFFILGTYQNLSGDFMVFALNTLAISVLLGVVYYRTKNIFTCILFHAFMNAIANTYLVTQNIWITLVVFIITIFASYLVLKYVPIAKKIK